jgi:tetratricopeptide (TPR) repeat protein
MLGKTNDASAACEKAISLSPTNIVGYQTLLSIHLQDKRFKEARQLLEQAAKQGGDAGFFIELAELHTKYLQLVPAEAAALNPRVVDLLDRARALKPEAIGYQLKLAEAYNVLGEIKKAVELYLQMQEQYANVPLLRDTIRNKLTDLYLRGKDRKKAMEQLEAIIKDHPLNAQAYYFLGGLAFEEKEFSRAAEYLAKTILLNPDFEQGYYDTAAAQINADQSKAALATLEQARKKYPQSHTLEYYSGLAHVRAKNYAEAVKAFTAAEVIAGATDRQRLTPLLYFQLGAAYERLKHFDEAESYFQKAIDLDPNFAAALNYLGYMWAERGINLDRAKIMLERALKMEPKNAAYLDSLGWIYFKMGQTERALEFVGKAIDLATEPDATLHDHLGDIYAVMKQWEKARGQWEKALKIEPTPEIRNKLEKAPPP